MALQILSTLKHLKDIDIVNLKTYLGTLELVHRLAEPYGYNALDEWILE